MMLNKQLNFIIFFSLFIKIIFVIFFHEKSLSDEWAILYENFKTYKTYSYYVFDDQGMPSSYMPPLYFFFININEILSFDKVNFIHLIYLNQILISTLSVIIFYQICKLFFKENFALFGALIFSMFPLMIYSNGIMSSTCLQLFLYLLFLKLYLKILSNDFNKLNIFFLILVSALTLFLRGEFLIIFAFSIIYLIFVNKKNFILALLILLFTTILISPYLIRNYINTGIPHIVNVSGYALWKGNNELARVEGFHNSLHPNSRDSWPKNPKFENLYSKLDDIKKDRKYEINRDKVFKEEAINNIILNKKKYFLLYLKKIFSYFFIDTNSTIKNYYNLAHTLPILLFSILSIPGAIIGLKKFKNAKIIYIFLTCLLLIGFISIFFILPRYKISIISFQIFFSIFFFEYLSKKMFKKKKL